MSEKIFRIDRNSNKCGEPTITYIIDAITSSEGEAKDLIKDLREDNERDIAVAYRRLMDKEKFGIVAMYKNSERIMVIDAGPVGLNQMEVRKAKSSGPIMM